MNRRNFVRFGGEAACGRAERGRSRRQEAGLPGLELAPWLGLVARAGTPPQVVTRLQQAAAAVLKWPDLKQKFIDLGLETVDSSSAELGQRMRDAMTRHAPARLRTPSTKSPSKNPETLLRRHFLGQVAALAAFVALPVAAQSYPDHMVTIINPFPGGPTDTFAQLLAAKLRAGLGQPVVVESRGGAGGLIGVALAAKAAPDGYTLLVASASTQVVQPVVRKSMPYDAERDFVPIMATGTVPSVIDVHPSLPIKTLQELIAYAKAHPGTVTYGSSGPGTALHLAGELFASVTGTQLLHVPYKSAAQAMTDLVGGHVKVMFDSPSVSAPQVASGKVRALAIMGPDRVKLLPDAPTTAELGMPDLVFTNWMGLYAPAGTPPAIIQRITEILRPAMQDADMKAHFDRSAMSHHTPFGEEFAARSRAQRQVLTDVVKKAGIPPID